MTQSTKIVQVASFLTLCLYAVTTSTTDAFSPIAFTSAPRSASSALHISVVGKLLTEKEATSRIQSAFETQTPESVGVKAPGITEPTPSKKNNKRRKQRNRKNRRRHDFESRKKVLKEDPDLNFYTLHSNAVSHLYKDMPINDIRRAIKRAQNLHDVHDLATIAAFLVDECDEHWGYGFRGSLLSRLAVAALHMNEFETAKRAIATRHVHERASMEPFESAAIVRGLMRINRVEKGWDVLEDELRLPLAGTALDSPQNKELLKHRARALASIASRHFFSCEPYVAAKALKKLGELGSLIDESHMEGGDLDMPWARLVNAASECKKKMKSSPAPEFKHKDSEIELPDDLSDLVWNAMMEFPCPGNEETCSIDDYFLEDF